jgi:hypothetical protein
VEGQDWIRVVSLRLRKPCPYLAGERCSIYPVRPLPCMLFPENLAVDGTVQQKAEEEEFKDYLCLHRGFTVSPLRAEIITRLRETWNREWLLSSFYLFRYSPFYIDFSNLRAVLLDTARQLGLSARQDRARPGERLPFQAMEHVFLERFGECEPLAGVAGKIRGLDEPRERESFFRRARDGAFCRELSRRDDGGAVVFRFVNGRLRARRQSLIPREYHYL